MGLLEDIARIQAQVRGGGTPIGSGLPQPFPTTQLSSLNLPQQAGGVLGGLDRETIQPFIQKQQPVPIQERIAQVQQNAGRNPFIGGGFNRFPQQATQPTFRNPFIGGNTPTGKTR